MSLLFQAPPIGVVKVIAEPLVRIRYGNAMWTSRGFEIWMIKWPAMIWGFGGYSDAAKASVTVKEPWRSLKKLVFRRAVGGYSIVEYRQFVAGQVNRAAVMQAWLVARLPGSIANGVAALYCLVVDRNAKGSAYDLARCKYSSWVSRVVAWTLGNNRIGRRR